jgi:hypothetical protein
MLLVIALSFVKLLCPYENSFHAFTIKIHVHTTISPCYASTFEVSIVPSIHPIKIKLYMCCDLSLSLSKSLLEKETWTMKKRRRRKRHMLKA